MRSVMTVVAGLMACGIGMQASVRADPGPPATRNTVQQMFDAAAAATVAGRRDEALATYAAIEARIPDKPASLAITRARKGVLLMDMGRAGEAEPALLYAQAGLARDGEALRGDRYLVALSLGRIAERTLDYPAARRQYGLAEQEAEGASAVRAAWAGQVRATLFDAPDVALTLADRALASVLADPAATKEIAGQFRTLRGRALLNLHDYRAARTELEKAMRDLGGLTERVSLTDVAARSDLAIASMLLGDQESARRYLAYTGAGQADNVFTPVASTRSPPCGTAGLTPQDIAVVEFGVGDDGTTIGVAPIYASRPGAPAMAFARAVADWTWTPEEASRIRPFYRALMRVELRCSTASAGPRGNDLLLPAVDGWFEEHKLAPFEVVDMPVSRAMPLAEAELRRREAAEGPTAPGLLPVMRTIMTMDGVPRDRRQALADRARAIAEAERAPAGIRVWFAIQQAMIASETGNGIGRRRALLDAVTISPETARDPQARSAIGLMRAESLLGERKPAAALALAEGIAADPALGPHDPMKVGALLRVASIRASMDDLAGARAAYERTGLTAQECALVDATPVMTRDNISSASFPQEAMRWGFEGWALTEFDITADGRTANTRAIIAYPPFVFAPASVAVLSGARFTQSYGPAGGLGCGGSQRRVRFSLPGSK